MNIDEMNIEALANLFSSKNILLIHVDDLTNRGEDELKFIGTLEEYMNAIYVLGAKVVFMCIEVVTEDYFIHNHRVSLEDLEEGYQQKQSTRSTWPFPTNIRRPYPTNIRMSEIENETYDLCNYNKELHKYKNRIGQNGVFELSASNLKYSIRKNWMAELDRLSEEAKQVLYEQISAEENEIVAKRRERYASKEKREQEALRQLRELISDKEFVSLKPQRVRMQYAKDKIQDLSLIDDAHIKREIQDISAKITARKL